MSVTAIAIEQSIAKQTPTVNGVNQLLAQITPTSVAVTVGIVLLAFALSKWVKYIFQKKDLQHKVPNWVGNTP